MNNNSISTPNTWIFQSNPKRFDILGFLEKVNKEDYWSVNQNKEDIKCDDKIYFWMAGKDAGIYGIGHITSKVFQGENKYGKNQVYVSVDKFLGLNKYIPRQSFLDNQVLKDCRIIKMPRGTNFLLTQTESLEIENLLSNNQ